MKFRDPMKKQKSEYQKTIDKINLKDSAVGIDAQFTHAIIIDYLQQLHERLDHIEKDYLLQSKINNRSK